jgi:hypothetical protein
MGALLRVVVGVQLLASCSLEAQQPNWLVPGDTTGAPSGCSASPAIAAITSFAAAMNSVDSIALSRVWAVQPGDRVMFTQNRFTTDEQGFQAFTLAELVAYARQRAGHDERLTIQAVTFNGWRGGGLGFGPVYVRRAANDFGGKPRYYMGQGYYECGRGLIKIGWGPRPVLAPGQRMIESQAYPPDVP